MQGMSLSANCHHHEMNSLQNLVRDLVKLVPFGVTLGTLFRRVYSMTGPALPNRPAYGQNASMETVFTLTSFSW